MRQLSKLDKLANKPVKTPSHFDLSREDKEDDDAKPVYTSKAKKSATKKKKAKK